MHGTDVTVSSTAAAAYRRNMRQAVAQMEPALRKESRKLFLGCSRQSVLDLTGSTEHSSALKVLNLLTARHSVHILEVRDDYQRTKGYKRWGAHVVANVGKAPYLPKKSSSFVVAEFAQRVTPLHRAFVQVLMDVLYKEHVPPNVNRFVDIFKSHRHAPRGPLHNVSTHTNAIAALLVARVVLDSDSGSIVSTATIPAAASQTFDAIMRDVPTAFREQALVKPSHLRQRSFVSELSRYKNGAVRRVAVLEHAWADKADVLGFLDQLATGIAEHMSRDCWSGRASDNDYRKKDIVLRQVERWRNAPARYGRALLLDRPRQALVTPRTMVKEESLAMLRQMPRGTTFSFDGKRGIKVEITTGEVSFSVSAGRVFGFAISRIGTPLDTIKPGQINGGLLFRPSEHPRIYEFTFHSGAFGQVDFSIGVGAADISVEGHLKAEKTVGVRILGRTYAALFLSSLLYGHGADFLHEAANSPTHDIVEGIYAGRVFNAGAGASVEFKVPVLSKIKELEGMLKPTEVFSTVKDVVPERVGGRDISRFGTALNTVTPKCEFGVRGAITRSKLSKLGTDIYSTSTTYSWGATAELSVGYALEPFDRRHRVVDEDGTISVSFDYQNTHQLVAQRLGFKQSRVLAHTVIRQVTLASTIKRLKPQSVLDRVLPFKLGDLDSPLYAARASRYGAAVQQMKVDIGRAIAAVSDDMSFAVKWELNPRKVSDPNGLSRADIGNLRFYKPTMLVVVDTKKQKRDNSCLFYVSVDEAARHQRRFVDLEPGISAMKKIQKSHAPTTRPLIRVKARAVS